MKFSLTFLFTALYFLPLLISAQNLSEIDSSKYFDFWQGEWNVAWDEGDGVKILGTNKITKILDEKVLQEEFNITSGKNEGFKGTSISVFNPVKNVWKQAWADNQGGYFDFSGKFEGNKRIFQTERRLVQSKNGDNIEIVQRMVFYDFDKDKFTWDWELSNDAGKTWQLQWRIFYTRKSN